MSSKGSKVSRRPLGHARNKRHLEDAKVANPPAPIARICVNCAKFMPYTEPLEVTVDDKKVLVSAGECHAHPPVVLNGKFSCPVIRNTYPGCWEFEAKK